MASSIPNNNSPSSLQESSSNPTPRSKPVEDLIAWATAHEDDPPHREKIERMPGDGLVNHGGPIRITSKDGVLTEYGEKVEPERLTELAATDKNGGGKEVESSSLTTCCT
jgi:hypothetical protein